MSANLANFPFPISSCFYLSKVWKIIENRKAGLLFVNCFHRAHERIHIVGMPPVKGIYLAILADEPVGWIGTYVEITLHSLLLFGRKIVMHTAVCRINNRTDSYKRPTSKRQQNKPKPTTYDAAGCTRQGGYSVSIRHKPTRARTESKPPTRHCNRMPRPARHARDCARHAANRNRDTSSR